MVIVGGASGTLGGFRGDARQPAGGLLHLVGIALEGFERHADLVAEHRDGAVDILLPDPAFPNWAMAATAAGAAVRTYPTRPEHGFVPEPAEVEAAITPRTRALLVCSPDNPTGAVYPPEVLAALVEVARRHDLWLLSDECYEAITFDAPFVSPAAFDTDGRVVVVGSVSKTYAMTGWRIGWVATPSAQLREVLGHLSEAEVACPSTVGQVGALAALTGPQDAVTAAVASYQARRDAAAELLASRGLVPVPGGYTWRTDARLTLPSPLRLTRAHARQFVQSVQCPASLVLAQQGLMMVEPATRELLKDRLLAVYARSLP